MQKKQRKNKNLFFTIFLSLLIVLMSGVNSVGSCSDFSENIIPTSKYDLQSYTTSTQEIQEPTLFDGTILDGAKKVAITPDGKLRDGLNLDFFDYIIDFDEYRIIADNAYDRYHETYGIDLRPKNNRPNILTFIRELIKIKNSFNNSFVPSFIQDYKPLNILEKRPTFCTKVLSYNLSNDEIKIQTTSPKSVNIDIEANEVFLSSQPQDVNKQYVITNPTAGQKVYIHWKFTIWGSGSVNSFYNRIWLRTQNGYDVIDVETHVQNPEAGYIYIGWFTTPWIAPGGNYILSLQVDIYNDVVETNENNNYVSSSFTVTPTNVKFDLEAEDVWISSQPYDWYKNHVLHSPILRGTEVFFYFQWTIWGVPETITNPYYFKMTLDGKQGFEIEGYIENPDHRKAGYTIKAFISGEGGNG